MIKLWKNQLKTRSQLISNRMRTYFVTAIQLILSLVLTLVCLKRNHSRDRSRMHGTNFIKMQHWWSIFQMFLYWHYCINVTSSNKSHSLIVTWRRSRLCLSISYSGRICVFSKIFVCSVFSWLRSAGKSIEQLLRDSEKPRSPSKMCAGAWCCKMQLLKSKAG